MLSRSRARLAAGTGVSLPQRKYVSLGGWCGPALILGKLGLRTEAYPFDFSRVTVDGMIRFVEHGFEHGFYPPGSPPYTPECVGPWVLFRGQHTAFAHFDLNSPRVQEHFEVKFDRFNRLLDGADGHAVTFFRTVTAFDPREELGLADGLESAVARRNPDLDFRIVWMVHDQGLRGAAVELAPLSPRMSLWALRYDGTDADTLFDRTHHAYRAVVQHSLIEDHWPAEKAGVARPPLGLGPNACDYDKGQLLVDGVRRTEPVPFHSLTAARFPWRCHENLCLIDGVASVGGTCRGVGSTLMQPTTASGMQCSYCGSTTYHAAGTPARTERPFTPEEDSIILVHLYKILTGGDKVAAVEKLAHEMKRGTFEIICRIQFLTNSSTKITDSSDPFLE